MVHHGSETGYPSLGFHPHKTGYNMILDPYNYGYTII